MVDFLEFGKLSKPENIIICFSNISSSFIQDSKGGFEAFFRSQFFSCRLIISINEHNLSYALKYIYI